MPRTIVLLYIKMLPVVEMLRQANNKKERRQYRDEISNMVMAFSMVRFSITALQSHDTAPILPPKEVQMMYKSYIKCFVSHSQCPLMFM